MRRSACVPLPTPGAPTRMMRAARLNSLVAIRGRYVSMRSGELGRSLRRRICGAAGDSGRSSKLRGDILQPHIEIMRNVYICTKKYPDTQMRVRCSNIEDRADVGVSAKSAKAQKPSAIKCSALSPVFGVETPPVEVLRLRHC